ncbi:protein NRT1/ PTR FAMILY 1.2-like [Amaranthus tricolor]|uniref:protein NRT1/ PTR FAMILY 1.2-like n=1 Tax=Amaranthus tricolor TaxID=29722 RepID=UPI0025842DF3|nr:protein NRT1/ PTR FAMILY 1.2-like [Amaranthus tricolor]
MESSSDEERKMNGHHQQDEDEDETNQIPSKRKKGGFITMPFIIANESFEKVASYGLTPNMILYLMKDYKMSLANGQNLLFLWSAATNFFPIFGAFLADSYLGRFLTIGFASIISFLGIFLVWLTTIIPHIKPPPCNPMANNCKSPTSGQYTFLVLGYLLMAIGAGGVRPCSQAFGADQVDQRENPKNRRTLEIFFSWYYACGCLSVIISLTVIVYIQDHLGWRIGFGIPVILMFLSAVFFFAASPFYVKNKVKKSLFTSLTQAAVAAIRNRKMSMPPQGSSVQYYYKKDSTITAPSDRLRCLNKACIIQNPNQDIGTDGLAKNPWKLCTVEEVEELKSLIRVLPIWSTGVLMSLHTNQSSFGLLQAKTMDRHLGSKFEVPAASFATFMIIVIVLWIPIYDRVLIPLASKIRGKPAHLGVKLRMGIGLFCSFMSMFVAGLVENIRRNRAISLGYANNPDGVLQMSAFWLVTQHIFSGLAEVFNGIGQTEFFYSEMPKSMSSIATCLFGVGMAVASLIASVILNLVDDITKKGGKDSWVSSNINKGHIDYYYWVLATVSFLNIVYYIFCSWAYGPIDERKHKVVDEEELAMLRNTSVHEKGNLKENFGLPKSNELVA